MQMGSQPLGCPVWRSHGNRSESLNELGTIGKLLNLACAGCIDKLNSQTKGFPLRQAMLFVFGASRKLRSMLERRLSLINHTHVL